MFQAGLHGRREQELGRLHIALPAVVDQMLEAGGRQCITQGAVLIAAIFLEGNGMGVRTRHAGARADLANEAEAQLAGLEMTT